MACRAACGTFFARTFTACNPGNAPQSALLAVQVLRGPVVLMRTAPWGASHIGTVHRSARRWQACICVSTHSSSPPAITLPTRRPTALPPASIDRPAAAAAAAPEGHVHVAPGDDIWRLVRDAKDCSRRSKTILAELESLFEGDKEAALEAGRFAVSVKLRRAWKGAAGTARGAGGCANRALLHVARAVPLVGGELKGPCCQAGPISLPHQPCLPLLHRSAQRARPAQRPAGSPAPELPGKGGGHLFSPFFPLFFGIFTSRCLRGTPLMHPA